MTAPILLVIRSVHDLVTELDGDPGLTDAQRELANTLRSALKTYAAEKPETYAAALGLPETYAAALVPGEHGAIAPRCDLAPDGWWCSRNKGHEGPCAARPLP
jgi:hypothetical protein